MVKSEDGGHWSVGDGPPVLPEKNKTKQNEPNPG